MNIDDLPVLKEDDLPIVVAHLEIVYPNGISDINYVAGRTKTGSIIYGVRAQKIKEGLILQNTHYWSDYSSDVNHQFNLYPLID